ncbi:MULTISPECIES: glutathione peroxidase [Staphylococcus]|jgi:glutathione peroxidase|uniref:Glutathione peroxidase n=2 Tax=Staphylococcus haemolyticus TaxID=1283 RepID=A0A7Z1MYU0_STAHA|nr:MULTISPECIES: glutathione peroxidase [Staphylococcus]KDP49625.1 glutathione peroxidase [Staphylococcus aureus subsp. aureus CO-98]MDU2097925.1 glutathione peroxidase [Staphylococcus sp.]AKC76398.1 glutathione peroxidase [Staphylococcus haemolyticus]AMW23262.1 glutathione peroxidase [Staphylococcus haemolyticus]AUV67663.1 glutathione peroxidase [Staphylococcus haemolyticus]
MENIYDFVVQKSNGEDYKLEEYKGKVMLIVNTASECGFTPQFEGLQALYEKYKDQGFVILGFPCNQFGGQEPGSGAEANQNCKINYGVTFPIHEKVDVKGENQHPLFRYLTDAAKGMLSEKIKWNFTKFLVDRDGNVVSRFSPQKKPAQIEKDIEKLL